MEMHFVHKAVVDGVTKLAVVGVFFEKGDTSPSFIKALMREALPKATGTPTGLVPKLDFHVIYFYFYGSFRLFNGNANDALSEKSTLT
jgi:carbonic anhydrase